MHYQFFYFIKELECTPPQVIYRKIQCNIYIGINEHFEIIQYCLEKNIGPKEMLIAPLFNKTLVVQ